MENKIKRRIIMEKRKAVLKFTAIVGLISAVIIFIPVLLTA